MKEFNEYWKLNYEGEYSNGNRNGIGKEYDRLNGKLIYEGEYSNGKRRGKIKNNYLNRNQISNKQCMIF
jgi:antitoxin component YwqK of YwqJK toxin-antitoxin module